MCTFGIAYLAAAPFLMAQQAANTPPGSPVQVASPSSTPSLPPAAGADLLTNGNFVAATKDPNVPDGWTRGVEGLTSHESENGISYLRLLSQQAGQLVSVSQTVPIPPGVKALDAAVIFRDSGVKFGKSFSNDARVEFQLLNASGQGISGGPGSAVFDSHAQNWTVLTRQFLVPDGATQISITFCLNRPASGTLDLQQARLTPTSDADTQALIMAPVLAAKKASDDEAEVQRMQSLPSTTAEIKVSGPDLVTAGGKTVWLQGVNIPSLEWSAKGEHIFTSVKEALEDWKANVVRLPVNDGFWFGRGKPPQSSSNDAESYRQIVDTVVKMAAGQGDYVVIDLHRYHAPDDAAVAFWKDAAARYKNNPAVLFDIFNEPTGIGWDVWKNGGAVQDKRKGQPPVTWQSPGMQAVVDAVRSTGARNIIIAGGLGNAYDLEGILQGYALTDTTGNGIMYAVHFYNWHRNWQKHFLGLVGKYPLFVGETGADVKKMSFIPGNQQEAPATWVPDALGMIQKYKLNWTAYSMHPKSTPVLITNWNYDPSPFWGVFVKEALAGQQFEMTKLR
jgi:endoglucanase